MTQAEGQAVQKILDEEIARLVEASPSIAGLPVDEKRNIWISMWRAVNRSMREDDDEHTES